MNNLRHEEEINEEEINGKLSNILSKLRTSTAKEANHKLEGCE